MTTSASTPDHGVTRLPLAGVRVVDLCTGPARAVARGLADLGADVIRVVSVEEPPAADPGALVRAANSRSVRVDPLRDHDRPRFEALVDTADIVVTDTGAVGVRGTGPEEILARRPDLVVVAVTDFGLTGPYRAWAGGEAVHAALSSVLSRSGLPGREPLIPPAGLVHGSAAAQAAWAALVAFAHRVDSGQGQLVDVSLLEATAQVIDPGFGIGGSATGGRAAATGPRGRPDARTLYPIFGCADGRVRICVLSKRQWRGMFRWLGEPAEFASPEYDSLGRRHAEAERLAAAIGALFATRTRDEIVAEGQAHGVPTAALLGLAEVADTEHLRARQVVTDLALPGGGSLRVPDGTVEIDGRRTGIRLPLHVDGEDTDAVFAEIDGGTPARTLPFPREENGFGSSRPFAGLRVLDLGVIVVGAETGRLFADLGADVVKIENSDFPDGTRQSYDGSAMTPGFAWGQRNKRSVGLNLRHPEGAALFRRLAAEADVVLSNFKPGTMESLGFGHQELLALNPRLVIAESSAFGPTGPWSRRMGYGPLVRATSGLTGLWRYPADEDGFSDAVTIYPDHVAARVEATAVLAALLARRRTGRGGYVAVSQSEVFLDHLAPLFASAIAEPGTVGPVGNDLPGDAPRGLFPCAGDDEWCVVEIRGDEDWARLAGVLGGAAADPRYAGTADRLRLRSEVDALVRDWTSRHAPRAAMTLLQEAGVPAGMMHRVADLLDDPHLHSREFFRTMRHPLIRADLPTENAPARFSTLADPPLRPAPLAGQHTAEVLHEWLGLSAAEIASAVADGIAETCEPPTDPGRATTTPDTTPEPTGALR